MAPNSANTPRRRPRQRRAVETVGCILEAAAQVLESEGFERMTTSRVALRAGTSVGSLYQYYPSKDAILLALLDSRAERQLCLLNGSLEKTRGASLAVRMRELLHTFFLEKAARPQLGAELLRHAPQLGRRRIVQRLSEDVSRLVDALLEEHAADLAIDNRSLASWILVHAVSGIAEATLLGPLERLNDPSFIDAVTAHVLGSLGVPTTRALPAQEPDRSALTPGLEGTADWSSGTLQLDTLRRRQA